jgi:hypothetical protein
MECMIIYDLDRDNVVFLLKRSMILPNNGAKNVLKNLVAPYVPSISPEFVLVIITQDIINISILSADPIKISENQSFLKSVFFSWPGYFI